jgi:hypothetical protein
MCSTILGFTDAEGLTSFVFYFGILVITFGGCPHRLVYVWLSVKIIWDDGGGLASAWTVCFWGCGAGIYIADEKAFLITGITGIY